MTVPRTLLLTLAVALSVAASARADTWVPADPDPDAPSGPTAPDGTAVVYDGPVFGALRVMVRRPDGPVRAPVTLGTADDDPEVAVASGGWALIVWRDADGATLRAAIIRPDGTTVRRVLDRRGELMQPSAGIDAAGNATVAWISQVGEEDTIGRTAVGPALQPGPTVAGAVGAEVAVSPAGRSLLAWSTPDALLLDVDGEARHTVPEPFGVSGGAAAINDSGAAVVAVHGYDEGGPAVVDRAAGGPWSTVRDVSGGHRVYVEGDTLLATPQPVAAVGADGRAVVAWTSKRRGAERVYGAARRADGAWDAATLLSSPARFGLAPEARVDAAGEPHVVWSEAYVGLRGARPDALAVPDTAPLGASATFPRRLRATRDRTVAVTVTVRCAKACEAQILTRHEYSPVREIKAGGSARLRVHVAEVPRTRRKLRVELVVSDRFGQLDRRTRTVRVRPAPPTPRR